MPQCPLNLIFMAYGKLRLICFCSHSGLGDISLHKVFIQLITFFVSDTKIIQSTQRNKFSLENLIVSHPVKKYAAFCHNS